MIKIKIELQAANPRILMIWEAFSSVEVTIT